MNQKKKKKFYRKPFLNGTFEVENREKWIEETFGNLEEMLEVSQKFLDDLKERQGQNPIVDHIGDILVKHVIIFLFPLFPFSNSLIYFFF